jgi:hypothetical protein
MKKQFELLKVGQWMGTASEESSGLLCVSFNEGGWIIIIIINYAPGRFFTSAYIEERHKYVSDEEALSDRRVSRESMITFIGLEGS